MKTLEKKIEMLEEMLEDPEKLNRAVYDVIAASDMNNDQQLSRAEFQKVLQDFGIGSFEAIEDLFTSLDKDENGFINFREFRHFFRAQSRIKLQHLQELKEMKDSQTPTKTKTKTKAASPEAGLKNKLSLKKWKSTRN